MNLINKCRSGFLASRIVLIWLTLIVMRLSASAAVEPYQNQLQGRVKTGDSLLVKDEKFRNSAFDWSRIHNNKVTNIVTFGLYKESPIALKKPFKAKVDLKIEYWSQPNQVDPIVDDHVELEINFDTTAGAVYKPDAIHRFQNGHRVKITVNNISSAELGDTLPDIFVLTSQIVVDRKYDRDPQQTGVQSHAEVKLMEVPAAENGNAQALRSVTPNTYDVQITWDGIPGVEEYDLEYTFIDGSSTFGQLLESVGTGATNAQLEPMFRNNATRVTLKEEAYNINLIHNATFLLFRVRGVSYDAQGFRIEDSWVYQTEQAGVAGAAVVSLNEVEHLIPFNWQYTAAFAEEGKRQETVAYMDGSMRNRQTSTVGLIKPGTGTLGYKSIVQQPIYDEFGRPLVAVMPVPMYDVSLRYLGNINLKDDGTPYTFRDAYNSSSGSCIQKPAKMEGWTGAAGYYSQLGPFTTSALYTNYIPNAEGYPFAVKRYTNDNTGRVSVQGNVGPMFQPGPGGKATRYIYGRPLQWELDRIFGNDVGFATNYLKTTTIDPNGQVAISYQNAGGKTIATALAGTPPENVDALTGIPDEEEMTVAVLEPANFGYDPASMKQTGSVTYVPTVVGPGRITYNVQKLIKQYSESGVSICSNCYYDLFISVTNNCGQLVHSEVIQRKIGSLESDCNESGIETGTFDVNFGDIGEHFVSFELQLSKDAVNAFTEDYVKRNTNLLPEYSFIKNGLAEADFTNCYSDCRTCKTALGAPAAFTERVMAELSRQGVDVTANRAALTTWANSLYNTLLAQCTAMQAQGGCSESPCDEMKREMMEDLSPGGQYALFKENGAPLEEETNKLANGWRTVFPIKTPGDEEYERLKFRMEDGREISPYDENFTLADLIKYWNPDWAPNLLPLHPEYCAIAGCLLTEEYQQWDEEMKARMATLEDVPLVLSGAAYSRTNLTWLMQHDKFFAANSYAPPGSATYNAFLADLTNYSSSIAGIPTTNSPAKSLSGYIDWSLYCGNETNASTTGSQASWNSCLPVENCRVPEREWELYSEKYFELKKKYYIAVMKQGCTTECPVGELTNPLTTPAPPGDYSFIDESETTEYPDDVPPPTTGEECQPGYKSVLLFSLVGVVSRDVILQLYYPKEYSIYNLNTTVTVPKGNKFARICVPQDLDVSTIKIETVATGPAPEPEVVYSELTLANGVQTGELEFMDGAVAYRIIKGTAGVMPALPTGCSISQRTFYEGVKIKVGAIPVPFQFNNVWVVMCAPECESEIQLVVDMEVEKDAYSVHSVYYYLNRAPGCENANAIPFEGCVSVLNEATGQKTYYYSPTFYMCSTCNVGSNSIAATDSIGNNVYNVGMTAYNIIPNTSKVNSLTFNGCENPVKTWYPCFDVTYNGVTHTYKNATVFSCFVPNPCNNTYNVTVLSDSTFMEDKYSSGQRYWRVVNSPNAPRWDYCDTINNYYTSENSPYVLCAKFIDINTNQEYYFQNVNLQYCITAPHAGRMAQSAFTHNYVSATDTIVSLGDGQLLVTDYSSKLVYHLIIDETYRLADSLSGTHFEFKDYYAMRIGRNSYRNYHRVWVKRLADDLPPVTTTAFAPAGLTTMNTLEDGTVACDGMEVTDFTLDTDAEDIEPKEGFYRMAVEYTGSLASFPYTVEVHLQSGEPGVYPALEIVPINSTNRRRTFYQPIISNRNQYIEISHIVCQGAGTPPTKLCPDILKTKVSRIPTFQYGQVITTEETQEQQDLGNERSLNDAKSVCETMADKWIEQLEPCFNSNANFAAKKLTLRAKLIELCQTGADIEHVNGVSTLPDHKATNEGYKSFKDVLKSVLGINSLTAVCNPWLLEAPYPYYTQPQSSLNTLTAANSEVCAPLLNLKTAYTSAAPGVSFYQYLVNRYGSAMTLTEEQLAAFEKGCNNCKYVLSEDITVPVFLDKTNKGCISPAEFAAAKTALATEIPDLTDQSDDYQAIFAVFMNHRWGFTLDYAAYGKYEAMIAANPGTAEMLCNAPPYGKTVAEDPHACLASTIEHAVFTGRNAYIEYINEVKRQFRKDYIAYCGNNKPSASMNTHERIYHYTLYYYDQSGNLVRTVPPEGVKLLTITEITNVGIARLTSETPCSYTGPVANTDKAIDLGLLSSMFDASTGRAVEMWLHNVGAGGQVVATTTDRKYLFQTCIDGQCLRVNLFKMDGSSTSVVNITESYHTAVDLSAAGPIQPWTHIVLQANQLASDNIQVYVDGALCPTAITGNGGACGIDLVMDGTVTYPEDLSLVKQLRLYNRTLSSMDIAANAKQQCFDVNSSLASSLLHWGRYNTPAGTETAVETRGASVYPDHLMASSFARQSFGDVTKQITPDAGIFKAWYDQIGRTVMFQSAEQLNPTTSSAVANRYSYTEYDDLGRVKEVGEKTVGTWLPPAETHFLTETQRSSFLNSGVRSQIIKTFYDVPNDPLVGMNQENLWKRVAASSYEDVAGSVEQKTYYSYDAIGNTKTIWQKLPGMEIKQVDYKFDIANSKVGKMRYQKDKNDQFLYEFFYDTEDRLLSARTGVNVTSGDGWDIENPVTDVRYQYYAHGLVGRMVLGQNTVQGVDYVYTLQGGLKMINGSALNGDWTNGDINNDGPRTGIVAPEGVAKDVFAMTLNYYANDYSRIGGLSYNLPTTSESGVSGQSLYNGNVGSMTVALSKFNNQNRVGYTYRYDQLGRLKKMRYHAIGATDAIWATEIDPSGYKEDISYDANGNILSYLRNGNGAIKEMDNLEYTYSKNSEGRVVANKLLKVKDNISLSEYQEDIKGSQDYTYSYDKIGNLVSDVTGGVASIEWTAYGKIRKIVLTNGNLLEYKYDVDGKRVFKRFYNNANQKTFDSWYVREASGNTIAIYENKSETGKIYWSEQSLYGFSRLGIWSPEMDLSTNNRTAIWNTEGKKQYELTNHLDNVMAVVSDKRIGIDDNNDGEIDRYEAEVKSMQDYYPFGMTQPGRKWEGGYRYGFNGQEKSDEIKGIGNSYSAPYWEYDPRLGKRWNMDPVVNPNVSSYAAFNNNPISLSDPDGDCPTCPKNASEGATHSWGGLSFIYSNGAWGHTLGGVEITGAAVGRSSARFQNYMNLLGGGAAVKANRDELYGKKLRNYQDGFARAIYGVKGGQVAVPESITNRLWSEANNEAYSDLKDRWASNVSGWDHKSIGFMFNPIARAGFYSARAEAVTSRPEGYGLVTTVGVDVGFSWVGTSPGITLPKSTTGLPVGGLYRRGTNPEPFSMLLPMQLRTVKRYARQAEIGLSGIKIKIVREPYYIGKNTYGLAKGRTIWLFPDAFKSEKDLVKTLGHERTHIYQYSIFGHPESSELNDFYELPAHAIEETFWWYFKNPVK